MHGSAGLHSAMAIKRQRRLREQARKRAAEQRERRLSSRTSSLDSVDQHPMQKVVHAPPADHTLATSIGMLHIGVCFLVFGMFLIGSGLLPDDMVTWRGGGWWNELVATGLFVIALGIFLIVLNRVMGKREEDDLNDYVQRQLTRSRSGHRLERDIETGCLTTKNTRRLLERKREDRERGLEDVPDVHTHSPTTKSQQQNGDLEKILEEDVFEREIDKHEYEFDFALTMIGAMPAVAVRHDRRKGHDKRSKRPSHLYIGGHWMPPMSPSPTPSPNGAHDDNGHAIPEYYLCGKLSVLQIIVGALLMGSIVLVVGLVQLFPNAADADHRFIFLGAGACLLLGGVVMIVLRCICLRRGFSRHTADEPPPQNDSVNSIDVLVQRKDTQGTLPSELDVLIIDEEKRDVPKLANSRPKKERNSLRSTQDEI